MGRRKGIQLVEGKEENGQKGRKRKGRLIGRECVEGKEENGQMERKRMCRRKGI